MVAISSGRYCGASATQMVARRQVRKHLKKIREREYVKLQALVPSVASKKKVTKVQVIEEAVRYIEELHTALLERFRQKHGNMAEDKAEETVRTFVSHVMDQSTSFSQTDAHSSSVPSQIRHAPDSLDKPRSPSRIILGNKRQN